MARPLGTLMRHTMDVRVSVEAPGPDDCDAATLVGIIREALETSYRLRCLFGGRLVTVTGPGPLWGSDACSNAFRVGLDDEKGK